MALRPADILGQRYRAQVTALRQRVLSTLHGLYDAGVEFDDLDASFALVVPQAASVVRAGQEAGVALTTGYLTILVALEVGRAFGDVGSSAIADVDALATGMDAIPALMKQQIGQGIGPSETLDYGRFLVDRFSDAEVTRAIDMHTETLTRETRQFTGWEGIVSGNACDGCQSNAGLHDLAEDMYRHGSCNCTKQYVVAQ